jgi:hypothetical protein
VIPNNIVQASIIAWLKSKPTILATLVDNAGLAHPEEIREVEWQGDTFAYPNIRVDLGSQKDAIAENNCEIFNIDFSILVFSELYSSKEANSILGVIAGLMNKKSITSGGVHFVRVICTLVPAIRRDERTWRSELISRSSIHLA